MTASITVISPVYNEEKNIAPLYYSGQQTVYIKQRKRPLILGNMI